MCEEGAAIGIDLGTTFSCAAFVDDGNVKVIHGDDGLPTMASLVSFKKYGNRLIGNKAKADGKNLFNEIFGKLVKV